jgi:hypothetical protein
MGNFAAQSTNTMFKLFDQHTVKTTIRALALVLLLFILVRVIF